MNATVTPLRCQEVVGQVATTDRTATADQLLDVAVKDAVRLLRAKQPGLAEYRLARAERAAGRILGTAAASTGGAR